MPETPARPQPHLVRWTGPERRVKKHLRALGWQVHKALGAFLPFHLVALHPVEGVKLLWVHAPRGPDPDEPGYVQGDSRYPVVNITPEVFIQRRSEPGCARWRSPARQAPAGRG